MASEVMSQGETSRTPARAGRFLLLLSGLLLGGLSVCHGLQPDCCAGITMIPAFTWPALGLLLALMAYRCGVRRGAGVLFLIWIAFLFCLADESRSLLSFRRWPARGWSAAVKQGRGLRVVTLNCAGGSLEAADEVLRLKPDIVLLQEAPSAAEVERLARKMYGADAGWISGMDTAILARGTMRPEPLSDDLRAYVIAARLMLAGGREIEVASLRLAPPSLGAGLWTECVQTRRQHRAQLQHLFAQVLRTAPQNIPVVLGGDFNCPAGDGALSCLRPRLRDAFDSAGVGWGDTVLNDFPVHRFDQIWLSRQLHPLAVAALETRHSDHRMVVCDLLWP